MGIFYDPAARKWQVTDEKTDYETGYQTVFEKLPTNLETKLSTDQRKQVQKTRTAYKTVQKTETYPDRVLESVYDSKTMKYTNVWKDVTNTRTYSVQEPYTEYYYDWVLDTVANDLNRYKNDYNIVLNAQNEKANQINAETSKSNDKLNKENDALNKANINKNNAYKTTVATATRTSGGDYVTQRDALRNLEGLPGITEDFKKNLETNFKTFYRTEKLQTWNDALGAKPAYGGFDAKYYKEQNPAAAAQWNDAVAKDDLDITEQYGENNFYWQHYTTQGKPAGQRGNAAEITKKTNEYIEEKPTDKELADIRNFQLGINTETQTDRLLKISEIAAEFQKAKDGDPYWSKQAKEKFLNPSKKDEFVALFRLSERPEDKQVRLQYSVNTGYGVTDLEDALNQAVGEKSLVDTRRFGALTQNVLKDTINEMKKAKAKESTLGVLSGLGGFSEIMDVNKTITNSILGDTGLGGLLSMTSAGKAEESLEKSLQNITGVRNNTAYNWQQWFDNALKTKYDKDLELGYTEGEAKKQIEIDADFARQFIDEYLNPRFNQSKSMDEFVEYLDVRQEEKNPFQTRDMLTAVKELANRRATAYLDQFKNIDSRSFNSDFYFNPTGDKARENDYAEQASAVAADWETAKKNPDSLIDPKLETLETWGEQAYRFGVDLNDKAAFARLHFQLIGSRPKDENNLSEGTKYDGAEDIINTGKVRDEIFNNILPALKTGALQEGSVFGQFFTPEEFADEVLRGLDPNDKTTWDEVLKRYGLDSFKGTIDELKEYIKETLRTGSAQTVRENIKYLNEKRERPTQEKLGITYIERPEDFKNETSKSTTQLFSVFQSAGYQGTEDEFYTNFFPDVDRSEQALLTKAGKGSALETFNLDLSDPFASLGTIDTFFDEAKVPTTKKTTSSSTPSSSKTSFFNLGLEEEEEDDTDYKSNTGQKILGEFTSMFKGL
jgi:hypothetical protein